MSLQHNEEYKSECNEDCSNDSSHSCDECHKRFCRDHIFINDCMCKNTNTGYYLSLCLECFEDSPQDICLLCEMCDKLIYVCCYTNNCGKMCEICDVFTCIQCCEHNLNDCVKGTYCDEYKMNMYKCDNCDHHV